MNVRWVRERPIRDTIPVWFIDGPIQIFSYLIHRPSPPSNLGERLRGPFLCPLGKASPNGGEACFVGTLSNLGATPSVSRWIGTQPSDGGGRGQAVGLYMLLLKSDADGPCCTIRQHHGRLWIGAYPLSTPASLRTLLADALRLVIRWPPDVAWLASRTGAQRGLAIMPSPAHYVRNRK